MHLPCIFCEVFEILVEHNEKERYGVDMRKKALMLGTLLALSAIVFTGCGTGDKNNSATDQESQAPAADNGEGGDNADRNDNAQVSPGADDGAVDDLGNDVKDAADDAVDGAEDVVDDTANALDGNDTADNNTNRKNK